MAAKEYSMLPQHEQSSTKRDDGSTTVFSEPIKPLQEHQKSWLRIIFLLSLVLAISVSANLFAFWQLGRTRPILADDGISKYARLARDVPVLRTGNTTFTSTDRAVQNEAWRDPLLEAQWGYVALEDSYSKSMGLLHSIRWPWDDNKGVYVVTSAHEMHCLHVLRQSINEYSDGITTSWSYKHQIHCLGVLLQTVMCNADDEPLYTGALHAQSGSKHPTAGVGAIRMCRDWSKLQAWQKERTACVLPEMPGQPKMPLIERYKHCPNGERPWEHSKGSY